MKSTGAEKENGVRGAVQERFLRNTRTGLLAESAVMLKYRKGPEWKTNKNITANLLL